MFIKIIMLALVLTLHGPIPALSGITLDSHIKGVAGGSLARLEGRWGVGGSYFLAPCSGPQKQCRCIDLVTPPETRQQDLNSGKGALILWNSAKATVAVTSGPK